MCVYLFIFMLITECEQIFKLDFDHWRVRHFYAIFMSNHTERFCGNSVDAGILWVKKKNQHKKQYFIIYYKFKERQQQKKMPSIKWNVSFWFELFIWTFFFLSICFFSRDMIPVIPSSGIESNFSRLFNHGNYTHASYATEDVYST